MSSLWNSITSGPPGGRASFLSAGKRLDLAELASASLLADAVDGLRGSRVLLATRDQYFTAAALVELDGIARRMILCTPDLDPGRLAEVAATAQADVVLSETSRPEALLPELPWIVMSRSPTPARIDRAAQFATEWVLLTSGTTGRPKLVVHSLESLGGMLPRTAAANTVWSTFYDIRRYGGLQIYLRAVLGRTPLVLAATDESRVDFLARAAQAGVTHISGTPSHWRQVLMSGETQLLEPQYVRLSGEIAEQTVLDQLRAAYPAARVGHAFASTEAGVAFDVDDGRAGFPADFIDRFDREIRLRVVDGTLQVQSPRKALRYLGNDTPIAAAPDGYVDTGDFVEGAGDRYYFRGRRGGVINVGGLKVYPEEVEAVLNADPRVRMSLVRARRNPITGGIIVADVVLRGDGSPAAAPAAAAELEAQLLDRCRSSLPAHKVPAVLKFVPSLELTAAGKVVRPGA